MAILMNVWHCTTMSMSTKGDKVSRGRIFYSSAYTREVQQIVSLVHPNAQ